MSRVAVTLEVSTRANRAPVWSGAPLMFEQGKAGMVDLRQFASDPDGDALTFRTVTGLNPIHAGAFSYDPATNVLTYNGADLGLKDGDSDLMLDSGITVEADDGKGGP